MENNTLEAKKLEIHQEQLAVHKAQDRRAGMLLIFAMILTGLLYFMFEKHLFLGEAITWGAYFQEWHSALDFMLMFVIVVMSAVFLAWTKHHAYLHFGLYGSIGLIVVTVIGFALFAEFFSSSASQDTKSRVLLNNDKAYQATIATAATTPSPALLGDGNAAAIAKAEQVYARCQANLGKPGYKHCNGDKANLESLKSSEAQTLQAAKEIAIQTNATNQKANFERQDKLKADSYNAVIVSIARFLGAITGTDYKDNIKTAIVLTMLIVAAAFEILHHFLSHAKERAQNAVYGLEMELAKYGGFDVPEKPKSVIPHADGAFKESSIGFTAPIGKSATAQYSPADAGNGKPTFKYQRDTGDIPKKQPFGFIPNCTEMPESEHIKRDIPKPEPVEIRQADGFKQLPGQLANVHMLAVQARAESASEVQACTLPDSTGESASKPPACTSEGLYPAWVQAVRSGSCRPSVNEAWHWIQKHIAPNQNGSKTNDPTRIGNMQKAFFSRAIREGLMQVNANYKRGGKKYIWIG
ncbi:MAG: hypothetical protein PHE17_15540 [Thiothrix sp.]|uniref:hypothetical protein n=1 Tax=Thiothrix sp. TaxID=1032 RepID=UPI002633B7C5|nr:hypothetical protein [Thiothrix sp.]MDD5394428.1 hypothetical protein [Thiothrix sp.]